MVNDELNSYMHSFISDVCNEIGPRASASEEEKRAGDKIEAVFKEFCDDTTQEEFQLSPKASVGGIKYGALIVVTAVILYWISLLIDNGIWQIGQLSNLFFIILAISLVTFAFIYFVFEVVLMHELIDFLLPKKNAKNVIGIIEPKKEQKHELIFAAHHDSAYIFNFFYLKTFGAVLLFLGFFTVILVTIFIWIKFVFFFIPIDNLSFLNGIGYFQLFLLPLGIAFLFFIGKEATPGAYDNLSGDAILLGIAKHLNDNQDKDDIFPQHTRIRLVSFACEEAGLRGSKRYAEKHAKELKERNAKLINIDSISMKDKLVIVHKETLTGTKLDPQLSQELLEIGKGLKIGIKLGSLPFGGSDAVPFARKKIPATSFMSFVMPKLPYYYHTKHDKPEVVDKESLGQVLQICLEYIKKTDKF